MGKDARQVVRDVWDNTNLELNTAGVGQAASGALPSIKLSWEQVFRKCYDKDGNKLNVVEVN